MGCPSGHGNFDTVTNVLQWCKESALKPYFIVPLKRFYDGSQYSAASNYAFNAVTMVKNTEQQLGSPNVEYWDIGNEVYEPDYDSTQYALLAGRMAVAIKAAEPRTRPVVCVQRKNPTAAAEISQTLMNNVAWWDCVAGFTFHVPNVGMDVWGGSELYDQAQSMKALFPGKEFLVTALSPSTYDGLLCANAVLASYEQLIRAGANHIVCWPVTHYNVNGRAWVKTTGLTPTGKALEWLVAAAAGNDMVAVSDDAGDEIKAMAFKDGNAKLTVFVIGKAAGGKKIRLAINGFNGVHANGARLEAYADAPESDVLQAVTATLVASGPFYYVDINGASDYQILKLEFTP